MIQVGESIPDEDSDGETKAGVCSNPPITKFISETAPVELVTQVVQGKMQQAPL